jgi:UPF0755 protein
MTQGARSQRKFPLRLGWMVLLVLLVAGAFVGWIFLGPATSKGKRGDYLYIRTGGTYAGVEDSLMAGGFLKSLTPFRWAAKSLSYSGRVRPGRYKIEPGTSVFMLVRKLRSGAQEPVKLVINKLRTKGDFARLIAKNLEADSASFTRLLEDSAFLAGFGLSPAGALGAAVPASYELYWNTSADKAFKKIVAARTAYWTAARKEKAAALGLTPEEVTALAAIVEEETNKADEKGNIASAYLNRLHRGMKLQADPTARWAGGDFSIKRITSTQTGLVHPYNTYYVTGLPPGPICTPTKGTMNAVLDAPKTSYLYFCAREDFSGYHRFAATYDEHLKNARLYQQALNARGIR